MKYLTLLLSVLLSVSSGFSEETVALAPSLVEAEQSLSEGKWLAAAKAYDEAAKKETGKGRWIALVRGAFARFRLGETKRALETANFVIREARGTVHDSAVGEAFFLKQQILFREKAKPSVRSSLLKTAVARLGWTTEVFRLYETEANLLLREGNADAAWRLYSEERMKPSEAGRNIYGVLRALYSRDRPVTADSVISPLKKLHEIGSPYLDTLLALARKRMGETEKKALLRKVAEWEREAGRKARATALYHECADDGGKRTAGNPESRVSAKSPNGKGAAEKKLWSRANSLIQARKYGEARKCLKGVSSTENKARRDSSLLLIGDCYRKEGRPNDALTVWKSLKGITESVSVLYEADLRAGDLLMTDLYDFDSARKSFAEAKSRAVQSKVLPTDPADEGVALCDALAGRYTEAIGYFQSRRDAAEKRLTADLLKWEALLEVCTNLAVRSHDRVSWERDSAVSELMFAAGRFKAAETAAVNCLAARQAPEDVCARLTMQQARCLAKMGSFEKALSLYGTFLKRYRTSSCAPDALLRAGVLCVGAMGLPDRGCVYFKAVEDGWRLTAQAEQALFYRLTVNLWTGNLKAASELREVFMKRYPRSNHLGIVRDEYGSLLTKNTGNQEKKGNNQMTNRCAKTAVLFCLLPFFIVAETVVLEPGQDKRKAVPIPQEKRTVDLYLTAEFPWSIRDSWIEQKDDLSLWMRKNKTYYKLSNAYAPNSFVVIKGELQKPGRGNGVPPVARLSVPAIDLSWDFDCGIASRENLEHQTPAALLVTTDATQHRNLLVTLREKSNAALIVQLFWTDTRSVRVYRDNIPIWSGSYQTIDGETAFRVEPVAVSESEITFTAKTLPDDYGHTMAIDLVKAFTYDLIVDGVKFNHTLNSSHDGIEIRRSYSEAFSIPNGEWTAADGALAPVCYRIGQDITVKAKFRTNSALLSNAGISAIGVESDEGWTFGTFTGRDVTFNGGVSAELEFTMQGTAPSAVGIFEKPRIAWRIQDVNGNGDSALEFARTGPHKAYAILNAPVTPWNGEFSGDNQNPWTNALELACSWARGKTTEYEVASQVTHAINETGPFMYDLAERQHHFLDGYGVVDLSGYINILNQGIREPPKVNCTDCSNFVVSFSNLLGCRLWSSYMGGNLFVIRPLIPIGYSTRQMSLQGFIVHRVAWTGDCGDGDLVFDACLRYNGAATPTDSFRAELPIGVMFSDGDEGSPFVYRERLCVPGQYGYDRCQARPDFKVRRQVK